MNRPMDCRRVSMKLVSQGFLATLLTVTVLSMAGCPDREPASAADLARKAGIENPVNEKVRDYVTQTAPRAGVQTELTLLRGSIQTHHRMHGAYPASLAELDPAVRLSNADEYDYDPATGRVKSRSYPDL